MFGNKNSIEIFASRDKIRLQLINLSKKYLKLENFDFGQSSYLSYIIDMLSVLTSNLMYYSSSIYREQFLTKAVQRDSVLNLSKMIGYTSPLAKASVANVFISIPISQITSNEIVTIHMLGRSFIPVGLAQEDLDLLKGQIFRCYAENVTFALRDSIIIKIVKGVAQVSQQIMTSNDDGSVTSNGWKILPSRVFGGVLEFNANFLNMNDVTETFSIPFLKPFEFYTIKMNFKSPGYLADIGVFIISTDTNNVIEEWMKKDTVSLMTPNETAFAYRELEKGVAINFGNGLLGKQPEPNTIATISVGLTNGFAGNVISGAIKHSDPIAFNTTPNDQITNKAQVRYIQPTVYNREPAFGGEDPPSVDTIRSESIKSVSANSRLVSEGDFDRMSTIVDVLPIENVFHILKQSDLKNNEITTYTDLIYDNIVVPTKNFFYDFAYDPLVDDTIIKIPANTVMYEDSLDTSSTSFLTMFDMEIDPIRKESVYKYYIDSLEHPVTLVQTNTDPTVGGSDFMRILPTYVKIESERFNDPDIPDQLHVSLYSNTIDSTTDYNCEFTMVLVNSTEPQTVILNREVLSSASAIDPNSKSAVIKFTTQSVKITDTSSTPEIFRPLNDVQTDETILLFKIYYTRNDNIHFNISEARVIIKQNMSDFMMSQVVQLLPYDSNVFHSADINQDHIISISDLNRVSELHDAGEYHSDSSGIDGYATGPGDQTGTPHSADENGDWVIDDAELAKVTSMYNYSIANSTESYYYDLETETFKVGDKSIALDATSNYRVYDVPTIKKEYYDDLRDKGLFTKHVYQKFAGFDVYDYKMVTDFVNIKFANTTGESTNMTSNKLKKLDVDYVNPSPEIWPPQKQNGDLLTALGTRIAISDDINVFSEYYEDNETPSTFNRNGGFIAQRTTFDETSHSTGWSFELLNLDDIFVVNDFNDSTNVVVIYNGNNFLEPKFQTPFEIHMVVFTRDDITISDTVLRQNILDSLIDKLSPKFGFDKPIYISEIEYVVQSVTGVRNCKVIKPTHNIFFDYIPVEDMTQEELLKYSPELIYFGSNNVTIEIR